MKVLEAVLATEVENEEQLSVVAKEAGLSEKAQEAALGLYRLMKGFSDELSPEAVASVVEAAGFTKEVEKAEEPAQEEPVEKAELVVKAEDVPESLQPVFKSLNDQVAELKEINKSLVADVHALHDDNETKRYGEVAKSFDKVGSADEIGPLLKDLNSASPELRERVESVFKAAQERISTGKLFEEVGEAPASKVADPYLQIQKAAAKLLEEGGAKSRSDALEKAMAQNPELVRASQETVGA